MIRQDSTALLETLSEVVDVYFGPESWDRMAGGTACGEYAGYFFLKLPEAESKGMSIGFANDHCSAYWDAIGHTQFFADFDFTSGLEIDPDDSWPSRPADDMYLAAARHIVKEGLSIYRIKPVEDRQVPYRGVEFTDTRTGDSFTFREDRDMRMYISALSVHQKRVQQVEAESTKSMLDRFIGSSGA